MDIKILEKPDSITYDDIHDLLWAANQVHRENGFTLNTAELSGEELQQRIGENGKCFVALDDDKLVATGAYRLGRINTWYYQGVLPEYMLVGVLPEYQGKGINGKLAKHLFESVAEAGYPAVMLCATENNTHAIQIYRHQGFREVDYRVFRHLSRNAVLMVKWLQKCPYSEMKRKVMFGARKYYRRLKSIAR